MPDCFFRRGVADAASTYELGSSPILPALPGDLMFSSSRWMIAFMSGGFRFNELWTLLNWGPVAALPASPLRSALLCSLHSRVKQLTKNTLDYLSLPIHSGPIVVIRIAAVDPLTHTHGPRHARTGLYIYIYMHAHSFVAFLHSYSGRPCRCQTMLSVVSAHWEQKQTFCQSKGKKM